MMESIILVEKELRRRGLGLKAGKRNRTMLSVHDSLTLNVEEESAKEVYEEVVAPIMERPIPQLGGFKFKHEAEMSRMWDWSTESYAEWHNRRVADLDSH